MSKVDELTIVVGGHELTGWEDIELTLRAEGFPNSFSIAASVNGFAQQVAIAGAACTVLLGDDLVLTGYIDRDVESGSGSSHTLQLVGRGLTQDLVDCSAEWPSGQLIDGDALSIAQKLSQPYGITAELGAGAAAGEKLPAWLLNFGETPAEIIQRLARNAGLLAYEDARGVLVLANVGTEVAASGIVYGGNVQSWSAENSMDARFSDYVCSMLPVDAAIDVTGPGDIFYHRETDPNVPRHRQLDLVLEAVASDKTPGEFTIKRSQWEAARRLGRSAVVTATIDSWRDRADMLWRPNTLVPVDVPGNRAGDQLILGEVTFRRSNESGTTADLVLMPRTAFAPEPIVLQPVAADIVGPGT
jgi:prophage tail gpP-like protein